MLEKLGIGIDIASVDDFRRFDFSSKPAFYQRLFLQSEINYCLKFKDPYSHFAGKFALKEAVKKSLKQPIPMLQIETFHVNSHPHVRILNSSTDCSFLVSLSHEKDFAIAIVLSESSS